MANTRPSATMPPVTTKPFTSDTTPPSITTDFLALVGFAARLGTCVNNDDTNQTEDEPDGGKSVRDEAMLLMSLLMGEKAEEILSDVKDSRCGEKRKGVRGGVRPTDRDMGNNFSFTFPSLSLQPDDDCGCCPTDGAKGALNDKGGSSESKKQEVDDVDDGKSSPVPSQLLSRTLCVCDKDMIRDSSASMAHNVLESFGAALVWRAKTWMKSLVNVLALKEQKRIHSLKTAEGDKSNINYDTKKGATQEVAYGGYVDDDKVNDGIMNSKEMQIIDAIVKSSEEVSVVNIKTSFRVLPNRVSRQNSYTLSSASSISQEEQPASKKAKKEGEKQEDPQDDEKDVNEYKVTHKLMFEATISMTSNDGVRYNGVKLSAPGYIQGTFTNKAGSTTEGGETLMGVSMTLDTDALAQSLERQSRLVVRRAAEAALMVASGIDCASSPSYMESPHVHHSIISPRYVIMSPVTAADIPALPPFPKALSGTVGEMQESERSSAVVSSSDGGGCTSDSSAATTPTMSPTKVTMDPSFPALLEVAEGELSRGE